MANPSDDPGESRRRFMRESMRRLTRFGLSLTGSATGSAARSKEKNRRASSAVKPIWLNRRPEMTYARLGRTRFMMSRIAMGCAGIRDSNIDLVLAAVDRGVNLLDTAINYGESETALAKIMPRIRDRVWLCSKTPPMSAQPGFSPIDACPDLEFWDSLQSSLSRLDVDTLDCYMLQAVDEPEVFRDEALKETVERAKDQGMIVHAGVSTHRNVAEVMEAAIDSQFIDVIMAPVHPVNVASMTPLLERAYLAEVGVIAMCSSACLEPIAEKNPLSLHELPEDLNANQLAYLYTLRHATVAGCVSHIESMKSIERNLPMATFDPGVNAGNELDAVVEEELWPVCSICGERNAVSTEALESAYLARYRHLDASDFGPELRSSEVGPMVCVDCATADGDDAHDEEPE